MVDTKTAALIAAITLGPGLAFIWSNDLLNEPLAWLTLTGLGGGIMVGWVSQDSEDQQRKVLLSVAITLMLIGIIASSMMGEEW